jgi:hypothetical protein
LASIIELGASDEFDGGVFGQVVEKPLDSNSCLETEAYHFVSVFCDGDKMLDGVKHDSHNDRILREWSFFVIFNYEL